MANEKAIQNIRKIIEEEKIECDFRNKSSFLYTTRKEEVSKLEKEYKALEKIGFKEAVYKENIEELPFETKARYRISKPSGISSLKIYRRLEKYNRKKGWYPL